MERYQIIQLNPETVRNKMFSGCLMVVDEIKSWGVQGYVTGLGSNGEPGGQAFYRARIDELLPLIDGKPQVVYTDPKTDEGNG